MGLNYMTLELCVCVCVRQRRRQHVRRRVCICVCTAVHTRVYLHLCCAYGVFPLQLASAPQKQEYCCPKPQIRYKSAKKLHNFPVHPPFSFGHKSYSSITWKPLKSNTQLTHFLNLRHNVPLKAYLSFLIFLCRPLPLSQMPCSFPFKRGANLSLARLPAL